MTETHANLTLVVDNPPRFKPDQESARAAVEAGYMDLRSYLELFGEPQTPTQRGLRRGMSVVKPPTNE